MPTSPPGRQVLERARQLLWIALVLYPSFWLLDVIVRPEMALRFLAIRVVVCLLYVGGLFVVYSRFDINDSLANTDHNRTK